jgi:hypothetical protein
MILILKSRCKPAFFVDINNIAPDISTSFGGENHHAWDTTIIIHVVLL